MADHNKLSFAKVVAATPEIPTSSPREPLHATTNTVSLPSNTREAGPVEQMGSISKSQAAVAVTTTDVGDSPQEAQLVDGLQKLKVGQKLPSLNINGTNSSSTGPSSKVQTPSDDVSQKGDSSSDLGTKPPSLDGKSITSGTTFNALDEKESLRPDDSASVQAATEDDDVFSVRGSLIAGSRMGSEVAARFYRTQPGDIPSRSVPHQLVIAESGNQGTVTPQSTSSEQIPVTDAKIALVSATSTPNGLYGQNPDEKLLEAMNSQKDRLFLLKLEEMVIEFVQDSKEPFMDLPPSNSFCRMLTHKLADYYHMTHSFEAAAGSVRIFRTPFCRVPPSLASIPQIASTSSTPPPAFVPKKIMRRGDSDFGPGSAGYSKPTSEVGSDGKDKASGKDKMSREEKEKAYNEARERIFGIASTEISNPENEDGTGVSRASSVSLRDKGKKGRRRRDSDTFETRSNYVAYATAYGPSHQPTWVQPQYVSANVQFSAGPVQQQQYPAPMQPMYGVPNQAYPPMMPGGDYGPQYNNMPNYSQPPGRPRYQPPMASMAPVPYGVPIQSSPQQPHGWPQPQQQPPPPPPPPAFNQSPYQPRAVPVSQSGIPYAFGALPANVNPHDPKSQHPIPGSFNRHAFNPKTQSFVPSNGMPPMTPPSGPYNNYMPAQQGSPQLAPQHMSYSGYQAGPPMGPSMGQSPYGNGGYNMMRQGSNTSHHSLPPYHHPGPMQHGHVPHQLPPHPPAQGPPHMSNKPSMPQGPSMTHGQTFNHLPTYGNPATLPQKPTT